MSPAFRVDVGDVVTVGEYDHGGWTHSVLMFCRPVPTTVEDRPFQRAAGVEEQGGGKSVQQVLSRLYTLIACIRCEYDFCMRILRLMSNANKTQQGNADG